MKLHEAQRQIVKSNARFKVIRAGRRFGKTILAVELMLFKAITGNEARIAYIAPTFQAARDIAWDILKNRVKDIQPIINETRLEVEVKNQSGNYSKISLRSWDSVETLRGQYFDLIIIDEAAHIKNFWLNWQEVLRPTLTDRAGHGIFISTPLGFNHFYDLCNLELTDEDFKSFHFTSWDNPHLPREELEKARETMPSDRYEQEYMASFQKTQGLVYKEFSREKHLYESLPNESLFGKPRYMYEKLGAVDFGYRNPAAVLTVYFNGEKLYVEDEWYKRERTDTQIADYVALQKYKEVFPDPENQGGIEELRRRGINARDVIKGKGSIKTGIDMIRELLIRGDLMINKKCVNLISEFEMYHHDDDTGEKNENENPVKLNDHALDALRYLVSSLLPMMQRQEMMKYMPQVNYKEPPNPAR